MAPHPESLRNAVPSHAQVYEQVETRGGFEVEARQVRERGVKALAKASSDGNAGANAWWDRSVGPLGEPAHAQEENSEEIPLVPRVVFSRYGRGARGKGATARSAPTGRSASCPR